MQNRLPNNLWEGTIDLHSINFELPEFHKITQMAKEFCDKPWLWKGQNKFELELSKMNVVDLYELYTTRLDLEPWKDKDVVNLRSKQIEKALWSYLVDTGVTVEEFKKLNISVDEMNNDYESLKSEYSH